MVESEDAGRGDSGRPDGGSPVPPGKPQLKPPGSPVVVHWDDDEGSGREPAPPADRLEVSHQADVPGPDVADGATQVLARVPGRPTPNAGPPAQHAQPGPPAQPEQPARGPGAPMQPARGPGASGRKPGGAPQGERSLQPPAWPVEGAMKPPPPAQASSAPRAPAVPPAPPVEQATQIIPRTGAPAPVTPGRQGYVTPWGVSPASPDAGEARTQTPGFGRADVDREGRSDTDTTAFGPAALDRSHFGNSGNSGSASPTSSSPDLNRPDPGHGPDGSDRPPSFPLGPLGSVPPARTPGRSRRPLLWAAGAGVLVVGGYVAAAALLSGSAPKGITVAGVPVGGKDRAAIVSALTAAQEKQGSTIKVALGEQTADLDLESSGLTLDAQATAADLTGFSLSPVSVWQHISGGASAEEAVPNGGTAKEGQLESALKGVSEELTVQPVDATVTFTKPAKDAEADDKGDEKDDAEPVVVAPAVQGGDPGTVLNIAKSAEAIRLGWLGSEDPLTLPADTQQPKVTKDDAQQALDDLAKPAVSGPLTLSVGDVKVDVVPELFAPSLSIAPDASGTLALAIDGEKLSQAVLDASPELGKAPKDARIELKNGTPRIVPGVQGVTLDPDKVGPAVLPALTSQDRSASVPTKVEAPKFSTDDAKALGVKEKVSTFSTVLTDNQLRTENLRVAARTVNGTLVLPGETFSLNGVLGERTPEKGYNQAPAINGGRLVQDYGGGVSQMATTIFNNVFFSGLDDIHHKPHSFYISRYPEGREATVNWPTVDLKWKNDSTYGVLIQANVTNKVNVSFWSTKVWDVQAVKSARTNPRSPGTVYDDKPSCVTQDANPGFDVNVTRIFKKGGEEVKRETFHTTYIAEDKVVCGPKPAGKSTGDED